MYDASNYGGRSLTISQQNAHFSNDFFGDRAESIHLHGNCRWLFYTDPNFLGTTHLLNVGYYASSPSWGGSANLISSARALPPGGTRAIALFQHPNYQGRMLVLYSSDHDVPMRDFGDHVSSVIVIGGTWTLYRDPNFLGVSATLGPGDYALPDSFGIGGDTLSSVRDF